MGGGSISGELKKIVEKLLKIGESFVDRYLIIGLEEKDMEKLCTKEKILKEYSIILKHWKSWKRIRSNGDLLLDYFSIRILYPNVTRDINRGDKIDKGI